MTVQLEYLNLDIGYTLLILNILLEHLNLWNANRLFIDLRHAFCCLLLTLYFPKYCQIYTYYDSKKFNIYTYQPRWSRYQSFLQNISSHDSVVDSCRSFSSWTSDSITTVMYKIQYISVIPNLWISKVLHNATRLLHLQSTIYGVKSTCC